MQRRAARGHRTALHRRPFLDRSRTTAKPTGTTWSPAPASRAASTAQATRRPRVLKAADYQPAPEQPDDDYPLRSPPAAPSTTSTPEPRPAGSPQLDDAAPDVWVEVSPQRRRRARARPRATWSTRHGRGAIRARGTDRPRSAPACVRPLPLRRLGRHLFHPTHYPDGPPTSSPHGLGSRCPNSRLQARRGPIAQGGRCRRHHVAGTHRRRPGTEGDNGAAHSRWRHRTRHVGHGPSPMNLTYYLVLPPKSRDRPRRRLPRGRRCPP